MRNHSASRLGERGRKDGYQNGWLDGWRLGACKGIEEGVQPGNQSRSAARILYVPQGFEAIDQGVIAALQNEVAEVYVVPAIEMQLQAAQLRPDAVLVMNGLHVFPPDHLEQIDAIRNMGIPSVIWFVDDPYITDVTVEVAPHYDYIFTHERSCLPLYQSVGCTQVHHLPLAAHFGLFKPMQVPHEYRTDICFIGAAFWNRVQLFDEIAPYLQDKRVLIGGSQWERMTHYPLLQRFVQDRWIKVPETVQYYNGAKIVINLHRTTEAGKDNFNGRSWPAESINPRTFEMAACGTLQLTDLRSELPEHYSIGSEIAVFHNAKHLIEQIDYYLTHEQERLQVAARGYRRTKKHHTFEGRIRKLLEITGLG
ncbi:CgeB family protein [Cohnella luojiensis]|uniref:Spore maturation protein n=1 Tax=Cohnella luojiensis TaxID=652876 RepID=A0A4Y8LZE2_9BACL|nr:glycosyltransferase [Cohnella luojiensis]TFE27854.1 spore maturation protein [Cohnella luojiensis]